MAARSPLFPPGHVLVAILLLFLCISPTNAFGAGNIASISKIEGHNWRHGDIEDLLKTIACLHGHKWNSMMIKRVYFGNWLRDYSQALDVGTLKGIQSGTIRILVWVLSFLSFGYATAEFEVTEERLGVYRPEEHIDNPKDYADNLDARKFDPRLRPPVQPIELQIDPETGMKNYIANERLGIATSAGYVKFSFARSIHFGRMYTSGANRASGKEADLCEALRCLGQGLHCLEDFGAHTNYTELALREQGFKNVFPHTGTATEMNIRGYRVFPLVTGTFGVVDFLHSVLGEATDHFAQTEIEQMDIALGNAQAQSKPSGGKRGGGESQVSNLTSLLSQVPGATALCQQAEYLQAQSDAQEHSIANSRGFESNYSRAPEFSAPPGSIGGPPGPGVPGMSPNFDPIKTAAQIYRDDADRRQPILEFRDKVARAISATIEKIPGLEALVEKITETLTVFILSLLAPFIRPIINAVSAQLKAGSSGVVDASGKHQYEPWTDPHCSDPTHSLLSKDHFSNILNEPAGQVAAAILQYVAPRIIYAWEHPEVPVDQVLDDINRVFHHPALRDHHCELHRNMYDVVQRWARTHPGMHIDNILSSESVRQGKNHTGSDQAHSHGGGGKYKGSGSHSKVSGAPWEKLYQLKNTTGTGRDMLDEAAPRENMPGGYSGDPSTFGNMQPSGAASPGFVRAHSDHNYPYPSDPSFSQPPYSAAAPQHHPGGPDASAASWNAPDQPPPHTGQYSHGAGYSGQHSDYPSYQTSYPPSHGDYAPPPQQTGYAHGHQQPAYNPDDRFRPPQQQQPQQQQGYDDPSSGAGAGPGGGPGYY